MPDWNDIACRGSMKLGTACCRCNRCLREIAVAANLRDPIRLNDVFTNIVRELYMMPGLLDELEKMKDQNA